MGRVIQALNATFVGALNTGPVLVMGPLDGRGVIVEFGFRPDRVATVLPDPSVFSIVVSVVLSGSGAGLVEDVRDGRSLIQRGSGVAILGQPAFGYWGAASGTLAVVLPLWVPLNGRPDYVLVAVGGLTTAFGSILTWVVVEEFSWWRRRRGPAGAREADDGSA